MRWQELFTWIAIGVVSVASGALIAGSVHTAYCDEESAPPPCDFAVVDVEAVSQKSDTLRKELVAIKASQQVFASVNKSVQQEHQDLKAELEMFQKGTPKYEDLVVQLAKKEAVWQIEVKAQAEEFSRMQAAAYARWNRKLEEVVRNLSADRKLRIVIRYQGGTFDGNDRSAVLKAVNRAVVFQDRLDISDEVALGMNLH